MKENVSGCFFLNTVYIYSVTELEEKFNFGEIYDGEQLNSKLWKN